MPVRRYRFVAAASIASLALLAAGARVALAQQPQPVLNNIQGLDFGRFVAGSGGTVTLHPSGSRSKSGGVILLGPPMGQAIFHISRSSNDDAGTAISILLPPNGTTHLSSGSDVNKMAVDYFVDTSTSPESIPDGGTTLSVGATLIVAPNQTPGNYSGSFSLIVNFE